MIKAVLFDLDGTFADTAPDLAAALNHTRAMRDLPPLPLTELRDIFLDYYANNICVHSQLFDDTAKLIDTLEQHGIKWGIVTNKPHRYTVPLMQALGYAERAACLVSGDSYAHAKPHPEPLLKACQLIGVTAAECLYVGDDLRDMQAANSAGIRGIIASYGYVSHDASVENWHAHGSLNKPMELLGLIPV